jgi:hypothetical protein
MFNDRFEKKHVCFDISTQVTLVDQKRMLTMGEQVDLSQDMSGDFQWFCIPIGYKLVNVARPSWTNT